MKAKIANKLRRFFVYYFTLTDYLVPQPQAEADIRDGVSFRGMNIIILITAILIASLGLNTNSTAVIIGAMLISPLMGPIIGIGLAVGIHDFALLSRSARNLMMAALFSVMASTLYFFISPVSEGHSELLARTSPTIYDVLIGFFGGAAGILAIGSRSKGNVIPGVAIATALMPPLCTAGYGLATWQLSYFFGAFYLFLINSVYIALATFIGVKLMKYSPVVTADPARSLRVRRIVYTIAVIVMLPSIWLTYRMVRQNNFITRANNFINEQFHFPATQVLSHSVDFSDRSHPAISVTLIGQPLPADSLELAMSQHLASYGLAGSSLHIIQGSQAITNDHSSSVRDVYQLAQSTISHQQQVIDSLMAREALREARDSIGAVIAPELKVLFPQIDDIAVSRTVFGSVESSSLDTVNVALVRYNRSMPPEQARKFHDYLIARLSIKSISVIDIGNSVKFKNAATHKK